MRREEEEHKGAYSAYDAMRVDWMCACPAEESSADEHFVGTKNNNGRRMKMMFVFTLAETNSGACRA